MTTPVPRRKKRVSKNKKKSWRKHTDISDVESFLEGKRHLERTGGDLKEFSDDRLFFLDKKPIDSASAPKNTVSKSDKLLDSLKCFSNLKPDPNVRIPVIPQQVKEHRGRRRLTKGNKIKKRNNAVEEKKTVKEGGFDLWGSNVTENEGMQSDHYLIMTKKKLPKRRTKQGKPSVVPAVEVAHAGASYNPSYDDHQKLMLVAHNQAFDSARKKAKLLRKVNQHLSDPVTIENTYLREMAEGIFIDESQNDEDEDDDVVGSDSEAAGCEEEEEETFSVNPPVRAEDRKTERQRKVERRLKLEAIDRKLKKIRDVQQDNLKGVKATKKRINKQKRILAQRAKKREEKKEEAKRKPKNLGKNKYIAPAVAVKLSDEIEGSLRLLKPDGSLLSDRFKSLQRRNVIEPRIKVNRKKPKVKRVEKRAHRSVTL